MALFGLTGKPKVRRRQVREQKARTTGSVRTRWASHLFSWRTLSTSLFVAVAVTIAVVGEETMDFAVGQRIDTPVYAKLDFQIEDSDQTARAREAARAQVPSYYTLNHGENTFERIRADLKRLFQAAAAAETFEAYAEAIEPSNWPADESAYRRLRQMVDMADDSGRKQYDAFIDRLPLEGQFVVSGLFREPRDPPSAKDFILLELPDTDAPPSAQEIKLAVLVPQGNTKALRGSTADVARVLPYFELRSTVEAIVLAAFRVQPTIVYDKDRTEVQMRAADEETPVAMTTFAKGKPFVHPGVLGSDAFALLAAHHGAYMSFIGQSSPEAIGLRQERVLRRVGLATLVAMLALGLMMCVGANHPRVYEVRTRTIAFMTLIIGMLVAARLVDMRWPDLPEAVLAPCVLAAAVVAIAYPRRVALIAMAIASLLVTVSVRGDVVFLLVVLTGVAITVYQLDDIRSRTKLITSGVITAVVVMLISAAGGLLRWHTPAYIFDHTMLAGSCALLAAFVASGVLPFIERTFRIATSLTLLEWRDPTKPLLQLLAREAPGTYNHSLALGTLAEGACECISANGLLAQVGALYHDIGKIHKAEYFTENQRDVTSRHEKLAPTMSLLIILGHVKDGIEMAKEYKLPRVLRQFIDEHHGTTVVRYFHHAASAKQPQIASGKHDREVPEAEFRYGGPKPRSRESAVLMLSDGVESATRALEDPTVGRIENIVHKIVTERLNDGQFDECDITLREIRLVEESLVKTLRSIYHGRVKYPKAAKETEETHQRKRLSV